MTTPQAQQALERAARFLDPRTDDDSAIPSGEAIRLAAALREIAASLASPQAAQLVSDAGAEGVQEPEVEHDALCLKVIRGEWKNCTCGATPTGEAAGAAQPVRSTQAQAPAVQAEPTIADKLGVDPAWADQPTPKPQEGVWTLTAPDGRMWAGESPLRACAAESRERVPAHVALARIARGCDESAAPAAPAEAPGMVMMASREKSATAIDANDLERMAKERPDERFLKGSGILKLTGGIRQLEGQLRVAEALLNECIGPLEVSAAVIESDDTEHMETLIDRVKAFVTASAYSAIDGVRGTPKAKESGRG